MGRSAKFHKRQTTKKATSSASSTPSAPSASTGKHPPKPTSAPAPKDQRKHAGLKLRAKASKAGAGDKHAGPVLGGADYVSLLLGGRRKAAAQAAKLPKDADADERAPADEDEDEDM